MKKRWLVSASIFGEWDGASEDREYGSHWLVGDEPAVRKWLSKKATDVLVGAAPKWEKTVRDQYVRWEKADGTMPERLEAFGSCAPEDDSRCDYIVVRFAAIPEDQVPVVTCS